MEPPVTREPSFSPWIENEPESAHARALAKMVASTVAALARIPLWNGEIKKPTADFQVTGERAADAPPS
jgi:hypothetical protein